MFFPVPEAVRRQAKSPHELSMLIMLASGAIYQAQRAEVPDRLVQRFPPPLDLTGADTEFASDAASA